MGDSETVRLTTFSHGAGCACKIGPADLNGVLSGLDQASDPNLLVGADSSDDAAVYQLSDELALVQTADFFTPIVDDPFDFGRIAAANAISDIYAMGGTPHLAINLVAFPLEELGADVLGTILRGGAEIAAEAGVTVGGGHSIDDPEPKYGMAVSGTVHPNDALTNRDARAGDELWLTKPLGTGLITTAAKRDLAPDGAVEAAIEVMTTLNAEASVRAREAGARAMTDVTGFGLVGHLGELCAASSVAAVVESSELPAIDHALELAANEDCIAGGTRRNAIHADTFTTWGGSVEPERRWLAVDAMTSGGLLIAGPPDRNWIPGVRIGELIDGDAGSVLVQ